MYFNIEKKFEINAENYFKNEINKIIEMQKDGLLVYDNKIIELTEIGSEKFRVFQVVLG